jgi:hypothetical protein
VRPLLARHFVQHGMVRNAIHSIQNVVPAVRRAGVTVTIGTFERAGFIKNRRGIITILDFNMLEEVSCECYRLIREQEEALLG